MRNRQRITLEDLLTEFRAEDLRFLCWMFRVPRGGSKEDLVHALLTSRYSPSELMSPASELAVGNLVENYVYKSDLSDRLQKHQVVSSGSKHELLLRLIENHLFAPADALRALNPGQLTEVYHYLFGRVPTSGPEPAIAEILEIFSLSGARETHTVQHSESPPLESQIAYDVALSFAGEQRAYVERVAKHLHRAGLKYFYDAQEETQMWGKDLANYLEEVFRAKARYCVMFLSKEYATKGWPRWEGQAAIAKAVETHQEYVLPVRFDETAFPGLRPTIKYLDARSKTPAQVAGYIIAKVSRSS